MNEPLSLIAAALSGVVVGMALMWAIGALRRAGARGRRRRPGPRRQRASTRSTLAVLAAAVHAALGRPARIHRVHVHPERGDQAWTRVGRMDLLLTHRVVPKR